MACGPAGPCGEAEGAPHPSAPRDDNEKGHVESLVSYGRRNVMVPVPVFTSWGELNAYLEERCRTDLARQVWGKSESKAERLARDREAMLPLPGESFEAHRAAQTRANSLSLVRFDRNDYSVPVAYAHHELTVKGGIEEVQIEEKTQLVAVHRRIWEREQVSCGDWQSGDGGPRDRHHELGGDRAHRLPARRARRAGCF